jgi:hypothetical protein
VQQRSKPRNLEPEKQMDELDELQQALVRPLGSRLGPEEGDLAFERHMLLAARIHRAARMVQTHNGDGSGWIEYVTCYFPPERNGDVDAKLLWVEWRTRLLKDATPGEGVVITHGHRDCHWKRETGGTGALCVNLESMWDDFVYSVEKMVKRLRDEPDRRRIVIERWRSRSWTVRPFASQQSSVPISPASSVTASP